MSMQHKLLNECYHLAEVAIFKFMVNNNYQKLLSEVLRAKLVQNAILGSIRTKALLTWSRLSI